MSRSFAPMFIMSIGDLALSNRIVQRVKGAVRGSTIAADFITGQKRGEGIAANVEAGIGRR